MQVVSGETASTARAAQARAIVEARYVMAMQRPRDLDVVRESLLKECKRPSFAKVARYLKPVGKGVSGPSIRFAEAAVRAMTNVAVEVSTSWDDEEKRILNVSATDLETNLAYGQDITIRKAVERKSPKEGTQILGSRLNSYGEMVYLVPATEDEILNTQNAQISKAVRNLGLRLIPGDIVDECQTTVMETLRQHDAKDPDAAKREVFDAFATVGVKTAQLKSYLGHAGETLTPAELADLRAVYAAIRDGEATWKDVLAARDQPPTDDPKEPTGATGLDKLTEKLAGAPTDPDFIPPTPAEEAAAAKKGGKSNG
jgi:hypothetical protein